MTEKKIKSFRSECLGIEANERCYGKILYNCETNDRYVSVGKTSQQKTTEMSQREETQA